MFWMGCGLTCVSRQSRESCWQRPAFRPIRGITLIDVIREGPVFFAEEPITVEFEVIRGVDELKGVPAALYFVNAENKYAGVPRVFDFLLVFCPGSFLLLLGILQLFVSVRMKRGAAGMRSPKTGGDSSGAGSNPFQE